MLTQNLFERVLLEPANQSANTLYIVSGYASATMVSRHFTQLIKNKKRVRVELIVGMAIHDGISKKDHTGFQELSSQYKDLFICRYVAHRPPIHSKVYAWYSYNTPKVGFTGSANYTQSGFSRSRREAMIEHDARQARRYFDSIQRDTVDCQNPQVDDLITIYDAPRYSREMASKNRVLFTGDETTTRVEDNLGHLFPKTVSFLDNQGRLPQRSGLNWGQRPDQKREPNQAYIRVPAIIYNTDFFPSIGEHFTIITDDHQTLICVRAQDNGKAIHTPNNNSQMGIYFRQRLGVEMGDLIQKEHLERYGRTDVDFYKIDEETYYMDFSI